MNKKQEEKLRQEFKEGFQRQFRNGLSQGVYAISKVIYDKATNNSVSAEERIAEIVSFCELSIKANGRNAEKPAE